MMVNSSASMKCYIHNAAGPTILSDSPYRTVSIVFKRYRTNIAEVHPTEVWEPLQKQGINQWHPHRKICIPASRHKHPCSQNLSWTSLTKSKPTFVWHSENSILCSGFPSNIAKVLSTRLCINLLLVSKKSAIPCVPPKDALLEVL